MAESFSGFPLEGLDFLADLALNNYRGWFEAHRTQYERTVLEPIRALVVALGERLRDEVPALIADPRTDRSVFRMHRDTRFSKNKDPYKTHVGLYLWEGDNKNECPGFYVQIDPMRVLVGSGSYQFSRDGLARYRAAAADPVSGAALQKAVAPLASYGPLHGSHFKKVPAGVAKDHPNAALLLHNGVFVTTFEGDPPAEIESAAFVDFVYDRLAPTLPLHRWLVEHTG